MCSVLRTQSSLGGTASLVSSKLTFRKPPNPAINKAQKLESI